MATAIPPTNPNGTYAFTSQPRAVQPQRKKYRDPNSENGSTFGNIMFDVRVVRGNTYRKQVPAVAPDPIEVQKQQEAIRRKVAARRALEASRLRSPEPVSGRAHIEIQTEQYLEELASHVIEQDVEVQTDPFLDRPPSPLYIPAKTGIDNATQIEAGDLFNFDLEVRPILEVLVGKTIEQALMEVMEEEELQRLRDHQQEYEELHHAEMVETQRMEEQAARRRAEKQRRLQQQAEVAQNKKETQEKIAARAFAQAFMADLIPNVYGSLAQDGFFFNAQQQEVELHVMPWLMDGVSRRLEAYARAQSILDGIILRVVKKRAPVAASSPSPVSERPPTVDATPVEAINDALLQAEAPTLVESSDAPVTEAQPEETRPAVEEESADVVVGESADVVVGESGDVVVGNSEAVIENVVVDAAVVEPTAIAEGEA